MRAAIAGKKQNCPMKGGKCRKAIVIYEARIETESNINTYIDLNSNKIKKRIATYKTTINCKPDDNNYSQYAQATELYKLAHKLKIGRNFFN